MRCIWGAVPFAVLNKAGAYTQRALQSYGGITIPPKLPVLNK